ncbi:unnamed protein product [Microthlaspi erraticum]|uniref:Uncharacterized protein n=1 Tax=Microthlaspi erraticum TaxID=1685480 RepID=A0A6D2L7F3_9BRAS|nr:unnamed protein product [Microthlaspi erraticum]
MKDATIAPTYARFDYIVIGGGTSGCALAATLSQTASVLLLERGDSPYDDPTATDLGNTIPSSWSQPFTSTDGVDNKRTRVLGGGTVINGGFYTRAGDDYVAEAKLEMEEVETAYEWIEKKLVSEPQVMGWQSAFINGLLEADVAPYNGLLGCKPVSTPIVENHKLASDESSLLLDPKKYRRLVGRLVYLCITRPELCYAIHLLSQFMKEPREGHWEAVLRVVRFIKGSPGHGVLLRADNSLQLNVFCDADFSACPLTCRSLSSYVVFLGGSAISWKTKKQSTVSLSSAESEYRAMAFATKEIKWIVQLMEDLGVLVTKPIPLYCDNKAAIHIAANPVFHERTKHIERDCHFVRDAVRDGLISTTHVGTAEQRADILTKALGKPQFQVLLSKLGVY